MVTKEELKKLIDELDGRSRNTRFDRLVTICRRAFGAPTRSRGSGSHVKFKTPWNGNPRINLQNSKGKAYQVDQVLDALRKLYEATP
ncbi:MAG: toxin HicA [bacterium]|nr:toxin HicA [bacterium]